MSKYDIEELTNKVMEKEVSVQFSIAGSCTDYDFFARMPKEIRGYEVKSALAQMPDDIIEETLKNNNIDIDIVESNKDGNCPYCGHDCEDEYIGIKSRLINEKYYDTVVCTKCRKHFDRVYNMTLVRSQVVKTTKELLKGDK